MPMKIGPKRIKLRLTNKTFAHALIEFTLYLQRNITKKLFHMVTKIKTIVYQLLGLMTKVLWSYFWMTHRLCHNVIMTADLKNTWSHCFSDDKKTPK